jgi:hypothetical protein
MKKLSWLVPLVAVVVSCACAPAKPYPERYAACYQRMEKHAAELAPGFSALGYQPKIHLSLDDRMPDAYGLHAMSDVMGDALPSGRIRLRPATLCNNDALARAVVAHEMAHVALQHRGAPSTGLVLEWEGDPPQEKEANALGLAVLRKVGGYPFSERFLECRLRDCSPGGASAFNPAFRVPPSKAPAPVR